MSINANNVTINTIVLYKNSLAVITECATNGKFSIRYRTAMATATKPAVYGTQTVRSKDFVLLSEKPVSSLENALAFSDKNAPCEEDMYNLNSENPLFLQVKECYELLCSDEETKNAPVSFEELISLIGISNTDEFYCAYLALKNTPYFKQDMKAAMDGSLIFSPRPQEEIDTLVKKANEKGREAEIRAAFLERLKARKLEDGDSIFMTDVEALALGRTDKSRTVHDLIYTVGDKSVKETPESAHKLLLDTGIWSITRNPYPIRWGLSTKSATESLSSPPQEERLVVDCESYAIDNEYSADPDDAVAWDGNYLWVHIADPASTVAPDSSIDKSARARGSTLYIPEGAARMLCEECLEDYALGLKDPSYALSFRIKLDADGNIDDCSVFKTVVKVKRLTYKSADEQKESPELKPLFEIARKNIKRRNGNNAVQIDIPQVHITVDENKKVSITPEERYESSDMVREMMLLAGEGVARFAFKNNIPFPFVSQEAPSIPEDIPAGLAGQFRLRRCMRKRSVGVTPGMHCGLGLGMYTQVTSPLRRYLDLIGHEQLRAFLDGRKLIDKDDMLMRVSEGDAGLQASQKAARKTEMHWKLVYLLQNPDLVYEAYCVDLSGRMPQFFIPALGLEFFMADAGSVELNGIVKVKAGNINIPELTVDFSLVE